MYNESEGEDDKETDTNYSLFVKIQSSNGSFLIGQISN